MRHIVWFSCGVASAVMSQIVLRKENAQIVRIWLGGEHTDNDRFADDVAKWLGINITLLRSKDYADHWEVIAKTRYVNGVRGARCTAELKKAVRHEFQEIDDAQYFGYTAGEESRAERFKESFPEVDARFPLIEAGLTKSDCLGIIQESGIAIPQMYLLGFNNNNCIGCVKGGMGYWNKIREVFPDVFERMAKQEREIGRSCIKGKFLDELDPKAGNHIEPEIACDFVCQSFVEDNKVKP